MPKGLPYPVKVELARREQVNKGVARLPERIRNYIGVKVGGKVAIDGPKTTIIRIVVKCDREEVNRDIVGLDQRDRQLLGVKVGGAVQVRKPKAADIEEATELQRNIWLFCYGSNNLERLGARLGRRIEGVAAYLPGYQRVFRGFSRTWESGVASLKRSQGSRVHGYATQVTAEELEQLDIYEGTAAGAYQRKTFKITLVEDEVERKVNAQAYVSKSQTFNTPSQEYLQAVVETISAFWTEDDQPVTIDDIPIRNPLLAKHSGVQSANPVPPDVDEIFRMIMGRGLRPEENEGIHTALHARLAIGYAFSAAEADGSRPVLVTINKTGLTPQLDAEGMAVKRLLTQERNMIRRVIEMVDAENPETPRDWLDSAQSYYEYEEVNPFAILSMQFWRAPSEMIAHLKSWVEQPSDAEIMAITGSQRYLQDIPLENVVAIEELQSIGDKGLDIKQLYAIPDAQEEHPDYQYHGTTLAKVQNAFQEELGSLERPPISARMYL